MGDIILLIEDDFGIAELMGDRIKDIGYEVFHASTGKEALGFLEDKKPFMMLLDYSLPDMNARELLKQIKMEKRYVPPFIITTGHGDERVAVKLMKLGARDYLTKNLQFMDNIINTIKRVGREIENEKRLQNVGNSLKDLATILEQSPITVVITDIEGKIEYVNPKFTDITGYSYEEAIGKNPRFLKSGKMDTKEYADMWDTIREGNVWSGEFLNKRKDGSLYWERASISPLRNADGEIIRFVAMKEDISMIKKAEQELVRAKEDAVLANKAKSIFLANMSHEIRTPMNGIIGFLQLLEASNLTDEQKDFVEGIKISGETLLSVINDILDISKIESGKIELEKISFDLSQIIKKATVPFRVKADEKDIYLNVDMPEDVPSLIGDPTRLVQVITNLLSNAMKFTDDGGVDVKVDADELDEKNIKVLFKIIDTGIGMDEVALERIFAPFMQADDSTTRKYGGTGLGLAICKSIVELMGGNIRVESKVGEGTCFSFEIELQKEKKSDLEDGFTDKINNAEDEVGEKNLHSQKQIDSTKILLVEDNAVNVKFFTKLLATKGLTCDVALNGKEAVERFKENSYDIIFMDCQMPVMDGYEATRQIRKLEEGKDHVTIVAMTAYAMQGDEEVCKEAGMDDYLSKPVDIKTVMEKIEGAVKSFV